MRKARIGSVSQTEHVGIFSIIFDGEKLSEFEKFIEKFKEKADFGSIVFVCLTAF